MAIKKNDDGTLRDIKVHVVNDNNTLRRVNRILVNDEGTLRDVYQVITENQTSIQQPGQNQVTSQQPQPFTTPIQQPGQNQVAVQQPQPFTTPVQQQEFLRYTLLPSGSYRETNVSQSSDYNSIYWNGTDWVEV
jgi:hypothetical protein